MKSTLLALACLAALFGTTLSQTAQAVPVGGPALRLWLDASDPNTLFQDNGVTPAGNGDPVFLWKDKSGNGFDARVESDNNIQRPVLVTTAFGSAGGLRFDAVDDGLDVSNSLSVTRPYTIFIVDQYSGPVHNRTVDSLSTNWLIGHWQGGEGHFAGGWVHQPTGPTAGVPNFQRVIGTAQGDVAANSSAYFINGANVTQSSAPNASPGQLQIGSGLIAPFLERSNADVGELIVYNGVLNSAARTVTENYLSSKYTIAISNDHYNGDAQGYSSEVFGIGRVDVSNVLASSSSGGLQIAQANNTLDDNEWLLAGHDSPTNNVFHDNQAGLDRWERVWYLDKTLGADNVLDATLTFDLTADNIPTPTFDGLNVLALLLYSPTDPYNFSALQVAATQVGDSVSFIVPNGLLQNGFYTLAILTVPEPSTGLLSLVGMAWIVRRRKRQARG